MKVTVKRKPPFSNAPKRKTAATNKKDTNAKAVLINVVQLVVCCIIACFFVQVLFLVTKGPAYISFSSDESKENELSLLHSQCINMSANSIVVDVSQYHSLQTNVTGNAFHLSSSNLSSWIRNYLTTCGITDFNEGYLVIESSDPQLEIKLAYAVSNVVKNEATVRYEISSTSDTNIDPQKTNVLSSTAKSLKVYPGLVMGEAYQSSVHIPRCIKVSVPSEDNVSVFISYKDSDHNTKMVEIDTDVLPEYVESTVNLNWSFGISDTSLCISATEDEEIQLDVSGRFVLDLWSSGASKIKAYLSGDLAFQYTTAPSNYALVEQLVDVSSNKSTLDIALSKDLRMDSSEDWDGKEYLYFSGKATQASISAVSLFPNIRMWLRENAYIAPLSILGSIITIYKLPLEVEKRKKKG